MPNTCTCRRNLANKKREVVTIAFRGLAEPLFVAELAKLAYGHRPIHK